MNMRGFINKTPRSLYFHKDLSVEAKASIVYYEILSTTMHPNFKYISTLTYLQQKVSIAPLQKYFERPLRICLLCSNNIKKLNQKAT